MVLHCVNRIFDYFYRVLRIPTNGVYPVALIDGQLPQLLVIPLLASERFDLDLGCYSYRFTHHFWRYGHGNDCPYVGHAWNANFNHAFRMQVSVRAYLLPPNESAVH